MCPAGELVFIFKRLHWILNVFIYLVFISININPFFFMRAAPSPDAILYYLICLLILHFLVSYVFS